MPLLRDAEQRSPGQSDLWKVPDETQSEKTMKHNYTDSQLQAAIDEACNEVANGPHRPMFAELALIDTEMHAWVNENDARLDLIKSALAALPEPESPTVDWKAKFEALESQWVAAERAVDNVLKILPELKKSPSWENSAALIREYIDWANARAEKAEAELAQSEAAFSNYRGVILSALNEAGAPTPEPLATKPISLPLAECMSIRDYFAGQALAGSLASQTPESYWAFAARPEETNDKAKNGIARLCYDLADAMLKAREVKP
jgi:hypothetical protein